MEIVPAILTNDAIQARRWLEEIQKCGKFKKVQVDFIDGEFTNNKTIMPEELDVTLLLNLEFEAHLMVTQTNLANYVNQAKKVGFDRMVVQVESISNPEEFRDLALDIHSPVKMLEPYLKEIEIVIVMGVEPGFGGQEFSDEVIKKIERLCKLREERSLKYKICVDGGVQKEHLPILQSMGVDEVAIGVERALKF